MRRYNIPVNGSVESVVKGTLEWTCSAGTNRSGIDAVQPDGSFTGSGPISSIYGGLCMFGRSVTGTVTADRLEFTFIEWYQGVEISFSGTRVP